MKLETLQLWEGMLKKINRDDDSTEIRTVVDTADTSFFGLLEAHQDEPLLDDDEIYEDGVWEETEDDELDPEEADYGEYEEYEEGGWSDGEYAGEAPPPPGPGSSLIPSPFAMIEDQASAPPPEDEMEAAAHEMEVSGPPALPKPRRGSRRGPRRGRSPAPQKLVQLDRDTAQVSKPKRLEKPKKSGGVCMGTIPYDPAADPLARYNSPGTTTPPSRRAKPASTRKVARKTSRKTSATRKSKATRSGKPVSAAISKGWKV